MSLTTQQQRVLDYLVEYKQINPLQAWTICGVYRLSAVILELRKANYVIETQRIDVQNKFGEDCNVGNYIYHGPLSDHDDESLMPDEPANQPEEGQ